MLARFSVEFMHIYLPFCVSCASSRLASVIADVRQDLAPSVGNAAFDARIVHASAIAKGFITVAEHDHAFV